ncbi:MAG: S8 family serine peptidase [Blastocatellia bacterium]|nr:S8 family serine peptidase [Blastocatellia bacterium]
MKRTLFVAFIILGFGFSLYLAVAPASGKDSKLIRSRNAVPGRYIVVFKDDRSKSTETDPSAASTANVLAGEYNAMIDTIYDTAIKGFSAEMSAKDAEALSRDSRIEFVEEDSVAYVSSVTTNSDWGLDRIDQRELPLNGAFMYSETGANVNVYVIDSGIRPTHTEFGNRASVAFDALTDGQNGIDCNGHGTHVAGTIGSSTYGVAKNARLYGVRVLPCSGFGLVSSMISGVNWVTANRVNPAVVNMSIAVSGISNSLNNAINNSVASGITFIVSAGNNGNDACLYSPATASSALVVGATGNDDARAGYSNFGACVDIFAPGNNITSLSHLSDTGTRLMTGTSMAAPMVAGAAALYLEANPNASPATVANRIKLDATSGSVTNIDTVSPNKLLYTWLDGAQPPTPGSVTIIKEVVSWGGGTSSSESFTYTASNFGLPSFSLVDSDVVPADRVTNANVFLFDESNAISVTENEKTGWGLTSISCTETGAEGMPNSQNSTVDLPNRKANIVVEEGESIVCTFRGEQFAPTAAPGSITGRLIDQRGIGLRGQHVTLFDANTGETRSAITNSFGFYSFGELTVSHFYVISVSNSKRYQFTPDSHSFSLDGDMFDMNFTATEHTRGS